MPNRVVFKIRAGGKDVFLRILLPVLITFILFVTSIFVLILPFQESSMMDQKRLMIKELVQSTFFEVKYFYNLEQSGVLTKKEAQQKALQEIKVLRYGPEYKDYFWVNDMEPRMLMHPYRSDLNGKNISRFTDPKGKHLFVEFVKTVKKHGSGYVDYMWQWKDNPDIIVPKISYVKEFKPWGWVIGTGIYIQDVKKEITRTRRHLETISLIILLIVAVLCIYIILLARKIDRQRVENSKAIYQSEKRNRILIENAPEGILLIHPETGKIEDVNPAAKKLFDIHDFNSINKIELCSLSPDFLPDGRPCENILKQNIKYAIKNKIKIFEWTFKKFKTGAVFICEVRFVKVPYLDRDYLRATIVDISERKENEKQIIDLRNHLSDVVNSMPSVLIGVDPNMMITEWNSLAKKYAGVTNDYIPEISADKLFIMIEPHTGLIKQSIENRVEKTVEKQKRINKEGAIIYENITIYPLTSQGSSGAVIRIDDVTQRVNLEEAVIQNKKMLSVGGLAAGMAHEINNPLAGIILSASILKKRILDISDINIRIAHDLDIDVNALNKFMIRLNVDELINNITDAGERAAAIIQNTLDFARQTDLKMEPHSIPDLMDRSISLIKTNSYSKNKLEFGDIIINRQYQKNLPFVKCDKGKIQQVFLNLLQNGVDAMGEVTGKSKEWRPEFTIRVTAVNDKIRIEVEDNGSGIALEDNRQIFEPFFTTKQPGKGTGLGLSVSYFIITDNHKGCMDITSHPGEGSVFIIEMPIL